MAERPLEICCQCECATGRAGRADDSLYTENDWGPYCPDCWQDADYWRTLTDEKVTELIRLTAQRDELRALLWFAWHEFNTIRARDGAPQHITWYRGQPLQTDGCTKEWWSELTDALDTELGEDTNPWPIKPWNEIRTAIENTEASS